MKENAVTDTWDVGLAVPIAEPARRLIKKTKLSHSRALSILSVPVCSTSTKINTRPTSSTSLKKHSSAEPVLSDITRYFGKALEHAEQLPKLETTITLSD